MAGRGRTERKAFAAAVHAFLVAQYLDWGTPVVLAHHFLYVLHHEGLAGQYRTLISCRCDFSDGNLL